MTLIAARGVEKTYRSWRRRIPALAGVDLDVHQGEVFGLIGPNGAGKTTLLTCLLGLQRPDRGTIAVAGRAADDLAVRARTGYLPERLGFDRELTGQDFLRQHARLAGLGEREVAPSLRQARERVQIAEEALRRPLRTYSRGLLQRIGLAQALFRAPDLLFLDEPASGMDPIGVALVREVILEERARGSTVVLNSHQLPEVERVCDRVAFIARGHVERVEVLRDPSRATETWEARVGTGQQDAALATLRGAGLAVAGQGEDRIRLELTPAELARVAPVLVGAGLALLGLAPATARLEGLFGNGGRDG
ncbi:MAG TPA: ABC transporter ATP-binding protein [Vicinamibacteria bacterium]|nr:ABC transporter ATP-binding protein [Vicinamibacteria bacterium]